MLTPRTLITLLRLSAVICAVLLTTLLVGPFQGLERVVGLDDRIAHAMAFYGVTLGLFAIAPAHRRTDLALAAYAFGVLIELAQGLTGRSLSLSDLGWDGAGILAALAPGLVERLRHHARSSPDETFSTLAARERRKASPGMISAATPLASEPKSPAIRLS